MKIISVTAGVLLLAGAAVYAYPASRDTLRVPFISQGEELKARAKRIETEVTNRVNLPEVEALIQSTVNPYWEDMKSRLEQLRGQIDETDPRIIDELQGMHDVHENWETLQFVGIKGDLYEARVFRVRIRNNIVLGPGKGGIRYCTGAELMNEKTGILKATLDKLSELGATKNQVEEFIAKWVREEAQALSLGMTLKNSGAGLDLGGAKGDVFIGYAIQEGGKWVLKDYDNWRANANLAKIARSHSRNMAQADKIGIDIDIPAPDVNTNPQILSWYEDEYLKYLIENTTLIQNADPELYNILKSILDKGEYDITKTPLLETANAYSKQGKPVPWLGVFTGKPVQLGGSLGRVEATGFGCMDVMRTLIDVKGKTAAIQGFGNVGAYVALGLAKEGAVVQYINDHTLTLYKEEGFSVAELEEMVEWVKTRPRNQSLVNYYLDGKINAIPRGGFDRADWRIGLDQRTEEVLSAKVGILVLAALENQVREDNVGIVKAGIVVEGANGPTIRAAEKELHKRGIIVIHDTLTNAGGVIVSSFETEQAVLGKWYSAEEVGARRRETLEKASCEIKYVMKRYGITSYRIAGDVNAILRIARARKVDALLESAFSGACDKLRLNRGELIEQLRLSGREAHNIFRYMLSQAVVNDLTGADSAVTNIWSFGSYDQGEAGAGSDIDLIIEAASEAEKAGVYSYFESLNRQLARRFNKIMDGTGISVTGLFDIEKKVFVREEIESKKGFASQINAVYAPVSLIYSRPARLEQPLINQVTPPPDRYSL